MEDSEDDNRSYQSQLLLLTNVSYILPALVMGSKLKFLHATSFMEEGVLLVAFFLVAFFTSWSYHSCRSFQCCNVAGDVTESYAHVNIKPCATCPETPIHWLEHLPFSKENIKFNLLKYNDYIFAFLAIILSCLYCIPFKECFKRYFLIMSIIWILLLLSVENDRLACLPVIALISLFLVFWVKARPYDTDPRRQTAWTAATFCFVVALYCFQIDREPYWIKHSLWHLFGGVGLALILYKSSGRYENINVDEFLESLSPAVRPLFRNNTTMCHW